MLDGLASQAEIAFSVPKLMQEEFMGTFREKS